MVDFAMDVYRQLYPDKDVPPRKNDSLTLRLNVIIYKYNIIEILYIGFTCVHCKVLNNAFVFNISLHHLFCASPSQNGFREKFFDILI